MCPEDTFPEAGAFRGISANEWYADLDRKIVSTAAFRFTNAPGREDQFQECSVNWYDCDEALRLLAMQEKTSKTGEMKAQFTGACRLTLQELEAVAAKYRPDFSYERRPITDSNGSLPNPYHGNLLASSDLVTKNKRLFRELQATLATMATFTQVVDQAELEQMRPPQSEHSATRAL